MTSILSSLKTAFPYTSSHAGMKPSAQPAVEKAVTDDQSATKPSQTKSSLSDIAKAARQKLNDGYAKLGVVGGGSKNWDQWQKIGITSFDRQTLYAIASNEGGMFSEAEMSVADGEILDRAYQAGFAADPSGNNNPALFRAMIDFFDQASPEEKSSFRWMERRAVAQMGYIGSGGKENVNVKEENSIIDMLLKAGDQLQEVMRQYFGENGQPPKDKDVTVNWTTMPAYREALMEWSRQNQNAPLLNLKV